MTEVSRNQPSTSDRHPKMIDLSKTREVRIAVIRAVEGLGLTCSCGGWSGWHKRAKVREDKAQRHLDKHHGGSGLWL